ncbi:twin-arginine translocase TatA/TatE family subunit [Rickettsiales bacterium]|nr:twin-arginine translocase TatA/TatE family subunit [Rickettsiales bacterium]
MSIGIWQLILILVLVLLFFGTGKLPKVMSEIGKGLKNLKHNIKDDEKEK